MNQYYINMPTEGPPPEDIKLSESKPKRPQAGRHVRASRGRSSEPDLRGGILGGDKTAPLRQAEKVLRKHIEAPREADGNVNDDTLVLRQVLGDRYKELHNGEDFPLTEGQFGDRLKEVLGHVEPDSHEATALALVLNYAHRRTTDPISARNLEPRVHEIADNFLVKLSANKS